MPATAAAENESLQLLPLLTWKRVRIDVGTPYCAARDDIQMTVSLPGVFVSLSTGRPSLAVPLNRRLEIRLSYRSSAIRRCGF